MVGLEVIPIFLLILSSARGDTPANCHFKDIIGKWNLMIGEETRDRPFHCSTAKTFDINYQVDLIYPNVAVDQFGNAGFWTLVYNQGFEIQLQGLLLDIVIDVCKTFLTRDGFTNINISSFLRVYCFWVLCVQKGGSESDFLL